MCILWAIVVIEVRYMSDQEQGGRMRCFLHHVTYFWQLAKCCKKWGGGGSFERFPPIGGVPLWIARCQI